MSASKITKTPSPQIQKLGIIAGGGNLPKQLDTQCQNDGIETVIIGIKNDVDQVNPNAVFRIGQASKIINFFKAHQVHDIVFIGSVSKPTLFNLWPDWFALKFFIKAWICSWGDDGLLKGAKKILAHEGIYVRGIHEFLPNLLMPHGVIGSVSADEKYQNDIKLGLKESQKLGREDKGQAVLIKDGIVIGRETAKGTSAMIRQYGQADAILVKTCKPQQDRDMDLPTLGSNTVQECIDKNMAGIVGQAHLTLMVDREKMVNMADNANLFLLGEEVRGRY